MKEWIRRWLGITEIQEDQGMLLSRIQATQNEVIYTRRDFAAIHSGLGRIISKLDPMYGIVEDDPTRVAESKALEERVIRQLKAEDQARKHTFGES